MTKILTLQCSYFLSQPGIRTRIIEVENFFKFKWRWTKVNAKTTLVKYWLPNRNTYQPALTPATAFDVSRREKTWFDFIRVTNGTDKYRQSNNGSRKLYVKLPPSPLLRHAVGSSRTHRSNLSEASESPRYQVHRDVPLHFRHKLLTTHVFTFHQ